ncbi:MAG: hypothetical protein QM500_08755 [Methylococcales bacterium]
MEHLINTLRVPTFVEQVPDNNGDRKLVSEELIFEAISTKKYNLLDDVTAIPSIDGNDILFQDDNWSSKTLVNQVGETVRTANFSDLTGNIKLEVKIIAITWLYLVGRKSKLSGLIRNVEKLIVMAKTLQSINIKSVFFLDRAVMRDAFIAEFEDGGTRSNRVVRDYYKILKKLCSLTQLSFSSLGYKLKTNMMNHAPNDDDTNQTYCMPLNLLLGIWGSYIQYFENIDFKSGELKIIISIILAFNKHDGDQNYSSGSMDRYLKFLEDRYQGELSELYNNGSNSVNKFIVFSSEEEINKFKSKKIVLNGKEVDNWRPYPAYKIDRQSFYQFYSEFSIMLVNAIQSMTGMRLSETKGLTHNSLIVEGKYLGVQTRFHKFAGDGGKEDDWACAPYVEKIFELARKINGEIFSINENDINKMPLATNLKEYIFQGNIIPMENQSVPKWSKKFMEQTNCKITKDDYDDFFLYNKNLKKLDKVKEEIKVGAFWPLRSHQYRRSLAVHTRRLNLTSNNTLMRQLKQLSLTMIEWYSDGYIDERKTKHAIPKSFAEELEKLDLDIAAEIAIKFQEGDNLIGKGGQNLMDQKDNSPEFKTYPSLKKARVMAARGKSKIASLGNGFYCMNGNDCDFKAVIQSSSCNPNCESMVADADSIPVWLRRYNHFKGLLVIAKKEKENDANLSFIKLELDFFKNALDFYGVEYE